MRAEASLIARPRELRETAHSEAVSLASVIHDLVTCSPAVVLLVNRPLPTLARLSLYADHLYQSECVARVGPFSVVH